MLFRRRKPIDLAERIRTVLWPRRSFVRSATYFAKRVLRLSASPHSVALGVAIGVCVSFTPYLGFHIMIAAAISWLVGGNIVASALGTAVGNPFTFPFIWGATFELGRFMLYGHNSGTIVPVKLGHALRHLHFWQLWEPILKPMTLGAVPIGICFGLIFYFLTRWSLMNFREQRRQRLAERARRRARASAHAEAAVQ